MPLDPATRRARIVLIVLAIIAVIAIACFMTLGARGSWAFVLKLRGTKLAGLVLVATAIATSTVLFQTVTNNRILTPSIMGFDALYILIQTLLVATLGTVRLSQVNGDLLYAVEVLAMLVFSGLLFRWLFVGHERSIHLLVLVGIIFGTFFRSLSGFVQRILDPNEFQVLQDMFFGSFNMIDRSLLGFSALILGAAMLWTLLLVRRLDVVGLGRATAVSLGLNYRSTVMQALIICAIMVSVSTALVGPVTFFGLLVASLAHRLLGMDKHRYLLPTAILLGIITLVGGQTILERVFAFNTALSIIVEFLGGITFIYLVMRRSQTR
ncbi:ABC transporter transmembrane protein [Ketogulonicigenium robustum]|uniref:ABC transporter transmembrane protein n=1 Tax=Ketogulonicigenium robustum TaxID=92947 RepID=A0A1W6NY36_9RHOB|nr:iron chelate uptake ABC transporter family permease subunit [Ketogulonicigenium robustum]ARO14099.1 ABC transporter transmembrane protein [Ketogulonicigenium robustum]